jgi:hypothetical protein
MLDELFLINILKVIRTKNWKKIYKILNFDSNNRILIPLSSFFYVHFFANGLVLTNLITLSD